MHESNHAQVLSYSYLAPLQRRMWWPMFCSQLMGTWFLIFRQVQDNYRFGGERHTDPVSDHENPNPATLAPHLVWLSTVSIRSIWWRATHRSGFRLQRPEPCNLSTTYSLVINSVTIRLASLRRLITTANRRTQARTR